MKQANHQISVALLTPYAHFLGGVESVNRMLVDLLAKQGIATKIISQEILHNNILFRLCKRIFGLNLLLAHHFSRYYSSNTSLVICNGEFSFGVRHNAAINIFHGCYYGYAQAMRPFIPKKEYIRHMHLAGQQKQGAKDKYVIAVSQYLSRILQEQGIKVNAVIRNAIDTERFRPMDDNQRNDRYLFVGSNDYYGKGFDILKKLADMGFDIDCVTSERPRDNRLRWLGSIPNEELPRYYSSYKAFLLPSRFEGCGLVALEAMACGTPVVMTSVGAGPDIAREIPEFVADVPWCDLPERMAYQLKTIEKNYERYSNHAREYVVRHHSYENWKREWLTTIERLQHKKEEVV